jgi:XTP/dITP diphosphohydrolase
MKNKLLIATRNSAKLREYRQLFQELPLLLTSLAEENFDLEVAETGNSMEENARFKAIAYTKQSQMVALADDSGLEVEALGGEPGVFSARYAGEGASDMERIAFLLSRLKDIPWGRRSACFKCVIAIARPDNNEVKLYRGECPGIITFSPRGDNGFGYDPIFYLPQLGKTMAELSFEEKNQISHRGQAAQQAIPFLKELNQS